MHCEHHDWTRQGTEGFLGHDACQGPDAWPYGEVSLMCLDPDGCLVRRHKASDIITTEDTGASKMANRERDATQHPSAKKCKKGCKRLFEKSPIGGTSSVHWRDDYHTIPPRPY